MKFCLACGMKFSSDSRECPSCHHQPRLIEEFLAFSPESAEDNDGFKAHYFELLIKLESNHFWFRSRNQLIIWAIQQYFPKAKNFLEIGCGTGFVLSSLENAFPNMVLSGSEIYSEGLKHAAKRLKKTNLFQMDTRRIPFENEFDVIGAFDVLEHVKEDELVLSQMHRALSKCGGVILTVPQHPFLWSIWDEVSCHKRRYTRAGLLKKLKAAGFKVLHISSFITLLLPMLMVSRLRWHLSHYSDRRSDERKYLHPPFWINKLFEKVCKIESWILKRGISFPAGGSLLCIGVKE